MITVFGRLKSRMRTLPAVSIVMPGMRKVKPKIHQCAGAFCAISDIIVDYVSIFNKSRL